MIYISVLENQKALKNTLRLKSKKIQGPFKDLHKNLWTFQGKMEFKDFPWTSPKIRTLYFSRLCEPWYMMQ